MKTTVQDTQMLECPACGEMTLHPKRKEMGYHVCVNCSTAKPVVGFTTVNGEGDHTYNDIVIMDQDRAKAMLEAEAQYEGKQANIEMIDFDEEDGIVTQSIEARIDYDI